MAQRLHKDSFSPCVGTWNCLSSGCGHGGVGECQLVAAVFRFSSGKHVWEAAAESRKDAALLLLSPSPLCPCRLHPAIELDVEQPLFLLLDATKWKGCGDQLKEQQALRKPDPSQGYFEALSFLASGYTVIPLIQGNKHMRNRYGKTRWLISAKSLILSLAGGGG